MSRENLYERVTARVIAQIEAGTKPWLQPWKAEHAAGRITRPLRANGQPYNGINILTLWDAAQTAGYSCPIWLTYNQAQELGGQVRKGERSSRVVYASTFRKTELTDAGELESDIPFLKEYCVFNAEQCDGLPAEYSELQPVHATPLERLESVEHFVRNTRATIEHGGNQAAYVISRDVVKMPDLQTFRDRESYYATALHELTHWTRHESRLQRDFGRKRFGDEGYAMEELVAELGSAFLCADLAITPEDRDDHAAYLASWLKVLKNDNRAIFTAASAASKACEFLHSLQTADSMLSPVG